MKHIKEYKIFENDNNIRDIIHECFIPVEDLTNVTVEINKSTTYDHVIIKIYDLNEEICEEIANTVSHCIGMDLYFYGAVMTYNKNKRDRISFKSFTSLDIEEFYNFITLNDAENKLRGMKIEFKKLHEKIINNNEILKKI